MKILILKVRIIRSYFKKCVFSTIHNPQKFKGGGGVLRDREGLFNCFGNAQSCYAIKMTPTIKYNTRILKISGL